MTRKKSKKLIIPKVDLNMDDVLETINIKVKPKSSNQKILIDSIENNDVILCIGPAGTGKTFLSCALSLKLLKEMDQYRKIVIIKSVTPLKGEEIGWVKGSVSEKMQPFIYSFMNNFEKITSKKVVDQLMKENKIEILPIAYCRGVNIDDSLIIIDETQNITKDNIKTLLTRMGMNSKIIMLGDLGQIDIKNKKNSSLEFLKNKFISTPEKGISVVEFTENDIVRHRLTKYFINIFDEDVN